MEELSTLRPKDDAAALNDELRGRYLTIWLDSQLYGVPIADVVQIVGVQNITPMPGYPMFAKGVIDLRGTVIPVIDTRLRLGKMEADYNERTSIIVINMDDRDFGCVVDATNEVTYIADEEISLPPKVAGSTENAFLTGVARHSDQMVLLLDPKKMVTDDSLWSI